MFKLPIALVLRLKWTGDLRYSIGLESPDPEIAAGATKMLHRMMDGTAPKPGAQEAGSEPGAQEAGSEPGAQEAGSGAQEHAARPSSRRKPPH